MIERDFMADNNNNNVNESNKDDVLLSQSRDGDGNSVCAGTYVYNIVVNNNDNNIRNDTSTSTPTELASTLTNSSTNVYINCSSKFPNDPSDQINKINYVTKNTVDNSVKNSEVAEAYEESGLKANPKYGFLNNYSKIVENRPNTNELMLNYDWTSGPMQSSYNSYGSSNLV